MIEQSAKRHPDKHHSETQRYSWPEMFNQGTLKGEVSQLNDAQTGGQLYSDTSPFSVPWLNMCLTSLLN